MEPTPIRRRKTKAFKAEVVGHAEVVGIRQAARDTNTPESTIRTWRESPDFAQLRVEKQEDVAQDVFAGFQVGVRRIVELLPTTTDIAKVAIATGVLFDKFALMSGQATGRTEHRDLIEGMNDHEKETLHTLIRDGAKVNA